VTVPPSSCLLSLFVPEKDVFKLYLGRCLVVLGLSLDEHGVGGGLDLRLIWGRISFGRRLLELFDHLIINPY
jgi:hypothetical protein